MSKVIDFQEARDRLKNRSTKDKIKPKMQKEDSKIILVGGLCIAAGILIGAFIASKK